MGRDELITLDGSAGEGGGQVLRTSLTLSMATGKPFRIRRIRANRAKPGLMRQHLTAVKASAKVCSAQVEGAELGSTELVFRPGPLRAGEYQFAVGTAGSTCLVFQTLVPALLLTRQPFQLTLEGGTHNNASPTLDFIRRVYLPALERMGATARITVERRGFFPAGGGRWQAEITPPESLLPLRLMERGAFQSLRGTVLWARIPETVPRKTAEALRSRLKLEEGQVGLEEAGDSIGPAHVTLMEIRYEQAAEIVTGFGERGLAPEAMAAEVARGTLEYQHSDAPVGAHLADQLLVPMVIGAGGSFRTLSLTSHSRTNIETIGNFLERPIEARPAPDGTCEIRIPPG